MIKKLFKKYKVIVLLVFLVDLMIPDPIPFLDEIILGVATFYGWY